MSNLRIATPFVSGINLVLNAVNEQVPYQATDGSTQLGIQANVPGLTILETPYVGTAPLAQVTHSFPETAVEGQPSYQDVIAASGSDIEQVWKDTVMAMTGVFPALDTPASEELDDGPQYQIQLDMLKAQFTPTGKSTIKAIIGYYQGGVVKGYLSLIFGDKQIRETKANNEAQLQTAIENTQAIIDNDEETEERKAQAQSQITSYLEQLATYRAEYVASLEELMEQDGITASVLSLITGVYSVVKESNPYYTDLNIQEFVTRFATAFQTLITE